MDLIKKATDAIVGRGTLPEPVGTINVVDPSPLNWLYITYNTVEELVRVSPAGLIEPAAMEAYRWIDDRTVDVDIRQDERFQDGEPVTTDSVRRAFDEMMRWRAPHPPGTQFNNHPGTTLEVTGEHTVRFRFPRPDGLFVGKLRAMHLMTTRFWEDVGFGSKRFGTGEGHW